MKSREGWSLLSVSCGMISGDTSLGYQAHVTLCVSANAMGGAPLSIRPMLTLMDISIMIGYDDVKFTVDVSKRENTKQTNYLDGK